MINIAELEKKFNSLNKFNLVFASFFFSLMTLCVKNIDKRIPIYELVLFRSLLSLIITLFIINLKKELKYLQGAIDAPKRPLAAIVGGSKVSSKIGVLDSLLDKCDKIMIGGGMIFTFYKARGLDVGKSLVEEDKLELARDLEAKAKAKGVELLLPTDVVLANEFSPDPKVKYLKLIQLVEIGWVLILVQIPLKFFRMLLQNVRQ